MSTAPWRVDPWRFLEWSKSKRRRLRERMRFEVLPRVFACPWRANGAGAGLHAAACSRGLWLCGSDDLVTLQRLQGKTGSDGHGEDRHTDGGRRGEDRTA